MKKSILCLAVLVLTSCQSSHRKPASALEANVNAADVESLYRGRLNVGRLNQTAGDLEKAIMFRKSTANTGDHDVIVKNLSAKRKATLAKLEELNAQLESLQAGLAQANPVQVPARKTVPLTSNWRQHEEKIQLTEIGPYAYTGAKPTVKIPLSSDLAENVRLILSTNYFSNLEQNGGKKSNYPVFSMAISCDQSFGVKETLLENTHKAGEVAQFRLWDRSGNSQKAVINVHTPFSECSLKWMLPGDSTRYGVLLVPDTLQLGKSLHLAREIDSCFLPHANEMPGPERFFLSPHFQSMTCPTNLESLRTLDNPFDGVAAKLEALTGSSVPRALFTDLNPNAELDFSQAPQLDLIVISYLVFRSDFYGKLIARGLKFHAARGTQVRILVSDVIQLTKDRKMLGELVASYPTIRLQEFRYEKQTNDGPRGFLDTLHRTAHVKIFATYSSENENANRVVIGGRNIHDGFVFKKAPDHSNYPDLVNYATGEENFTHWRDFEVAFKGHAITERIIAHFLTLWYREPDYNFRSINLNIPTGQKVDPNYFKQSSSQPLVRHFISVPYADNERLLDFYSELIDSADKEIKISTPYFRPTPKVGEALERAVSRGVKVTLITRIDLKGDTAASFLEEVNKQGINEFWRKIQVYEYTEPNVILHSKLVLIDGRLSFIGSINLNKRSFYHDMENGILVYSKKVHDSVAATYAGYLQTARLIEEDQRVDFFKGILLRAVDREF